MAAMGALGAMKSAAGPVVEEAAEPASATSIVDALKQALVEKCSSLDHAFCWLDFNSRGRLTRSQFDTGCRVLNLEGPLKSIKPTKIFAMIDKKSAGSVGIEEWRDFFGYSEDDEEEAAGDASRGTTARPGGARGASVLQKVKKLAGFLRNSTPGTKDDCEVSSSKSGILPDIDAILQSADDGDLVDTSIIEAGSSLQHLGRVSRKKASSLVATDMHKAEAMQIQRDLAVLDYKGVRALAYILTAKCGSVEKAFNWLDYNGTGSFTLMQWETATMVMHIDIEALTGMKARDMFNRMCGKKGRVTKKQFDRFFSGEMDEEAWSKINDLHSTFKGRSRKVLKGLLALGPRRSHARRISAPQGSNPGARRHSQAKDSAASTNSTRGGASMQAVTSAALAAGWNQRTTSPSGSAAPADVGEPAEPSKGPKKPEASRRASGARRSLRSSAAADAAKGTKAKAGGGSDPAAGGWVAVSDEQALGLHAGQLTPTEGKDSQQALEVLNLGGSLEDFLEGARKRLQALQRGQTLNFTSLLSAEKLQALQGLATELGFVGALVGEDGEDGGRSLCIGHLGDLAGQVRDRLRAIAPGESKEISSLLDGCPSDQHRLAHALLRQVAAEEGLIVEASHVLRPEAGDSSGDEGSESEEEDEEEEEEQGSLGPPLVLDEATVKERVAELFGRYASGKQGRINVFIRKPDLTQFISDALAAEKRKPSQRVIEWIEAEYEETLELQVDMGSKYHYGIVLEFFQVFLCKAAGALDRSLVGLLAELLHWFQKPAKSKKRRRASQVRGSAA